MSLCSRGKATLIVTAQSSQKRWLASHKTDMEHLELVSNDLCNARALPTDSADTPKACEHFLQLSPNEPNELK